MSNVEKQEKILQLKELATSRGWQIIKDELKEALALTESKLFGETKAEDFETQEHLRRERVDRLILISFPEDMIKELEEEIAEVEEDTEENLIDSSSLEVYE